MSKTSILRNESGIAIILIVLLAGLGITTATAGAVVYQKTQNEKKAQEQQKADQEVADKKLAELKEEKAKKKVTPAPTPVVVVPPPVATPKPAPAAPAAPKIVNPTNGDCGKGPFTVYASLSGGAKAYLQTNRSSTVLATYNYGTTLSIECATDVNGNPLGWLLYNDGFINYADVSKTKP